MDNELNYLSGFGNYHQSEAETGALPKKQNSPQHVPMGLYAEQLSGSAFTVGRSHNHFSWLYRIQPSVVQSEFKPLQSTSMPSLPFKHPTPPTQMRWLPQPYPEKPTVFIEDWITYVANGAPKTRTGSAIHHYSCNTSMDDNYFYNSDGELLIIPEEGRLRFKTEFGLLDVAPKEIIVIPRGVKFQVELLDKQARGYINENFGANFILPDLGPMGPNASARKHHFLQPTAWYEEKKGNYKLITKFQGHLWEAQIDHSPLDVVAWHGDYLPYKYDLTLFNTHNSVSFDHTDPSVFTVLTSPTPTPGVANVDFVIFPERWVVMEDTMRLPYYHRNIMSEYMGLIHGEYDAKTDSGFKPGGSSLHNCMTSHGPDAASYEKAISVDLKPEYYSDTLAFMLETCLPWQVSDIALNCA